MRLPCLWSSSCGSSPSPPSWSSSASPRTRQARRLPPLHLLKVHALSANPVQILRGTGQLLPSFGIRLPVVRGDLTEFDGGFGQRCCSCSAIRTFEDGDEMKSARKIIFWSLRISDNYVLLLNRKENRCNHIYVYML